MKKILLITIILITLFTSCKKKVYLTDEQKALLLYDVGDKFTLVKNDTDTLNFEVTKKEFDFGDDYNGLFKTGTYYEYGNVEYKSGNIVSSIKITSRPRKSPEEFYWLNFITNKNTIFFYNYSKTSNIIINSKTYKNCYQTLSYDNDTMYISTDVGILYIKSENGDEYKLLEQ